MAICSESTLRVIALDGGIGNFQFVRLTVWTDGAEVREGFVLEFGSVFLGPVDDVGGCLLYTSPSPRDQRGSRMPSSA